MHLPAYWYVHDCCCLAGVGGVIESVSENCSEPSQQQQQLRFHQILESGGINFPFVTNKAIWATMQ